MVAYSSSLPGIVEVDLPAAAVVLEVAHWMMGEEDKALSIVE